MANVAHSTLTGSNLHENKGVASATDNTVATASSGSTVWKKLDNTNLAALGNPFGANLLHVREEQASGVNSSQSFTGTWNTVVLNTTKTNEITSASLSSNQISLPAGTYFVEGYVISGSATSGVSTTTGKTRIRNITDSADLVVGPNLVTGANNNGQVIVVPIKGRFTIAGTKTIEFQCYPGGGYRPASSSGSVEVYSDLMIWRVS